MGEAAKPETHEMKQPPHAKDNFILNACTTKSKITSSTVLMLNAFIKQSDMLSLVFQVDCLNLTLMTSPQDLELV